MHRPCYARVDSLGGRNVHFDQLPRDTGHDPSLLPHLLLHASLLVLRASSRRERELERHLDGRRLPHHRLHRHGLQTARRG